MRIFPAKFVKGVIDLYFALKENDNSKIKKAYEAWGFKDIDDKLMAVLNKWAFMEQVKVQHMIQFIMAQNEVRRIQDSDSGIYGAKIAGEVHKELKKYGGVKPLIMYIPGSLFLWIELLWDWDLSLFISKLKSIGISYFTH